MSELRIDCPHCGSSFDVQLDGEPSNMMVFCCARCKTPLMFFHGVVSELDREEFANLRKRLVKALDAVVNRDSTMAGVAESIKKIVEESEEIAAEREATEQQAAAENQSAVLNDETLSALQRELDNLDAESFLDKL